MLTRFLVFGDPVELLLTVAQTNGALTVVTQTSQPGGSPPPHRHTHEDELFQTLSGRFELFDGSSNTWHEIPAGQVVFSPRGSVHTFRNCGSTEGTLQITVTGPNFDGFLPGLSRFNLPEDLQAAVDYSAAFGITYPTLPPPSAAAVPSSQATPDATPSLAAR